MTLDQILKSANSLWRKCQKDRRLLLVACTAAVVDLLVKRYFAIKLYRKWKGYPAGPVGWPLLGNAVTFLGSPYAFLSAIGSYGKMTSVQLGWNINIFVNDVDTARKVLRHPSIGPQRPPLPNKPFLKHFLGLNGPSWKQRRGYLSSELASKLSNSTFSYGIVQNTIKHNVFPDLDQLSRSNGLWYPSKHCAYIDMKLMLDGLYGVNASINADPSEYVEKLLPFTELWFQSILKVLVLAAYVPFRVPNWIFDRFTNNHNDLERAATGVIVEFMEKSGFTFDTKHKTLSRNSDQKAFVDFLINKTELDSDTIMADVALTLIAGTNTTSKALEYGFLLLAKHRDIQQRIYEEVKALNDLRKELHKAHVLRAFIQETLRLAAVVPMGIPHYATETVEVDGMVIPKGALVHVNMYYFLRIAGGEEMNVDQWLDQNGKFKNKPHKFMSFGHGGRNCPMEGVAMKVMSYVLSTIIMGYELEAVNTEAAGKIVQRFATVSTIEPQIGVRVRSRS